MKNRNTIWFVCILVGGFSLVMLYVLITGKMATTSEPEETQVVAKKAPTKDQMTTVSEPEKVRAVEKKDPTAYQMTTKSELEAPSMTEKKANVSTEKIPLEKEKELVDIAYKHAGLVMEIKNKNYYNIIIEGNIAIVTWPYEHTKGELIRPGPDYVARVKLNKDTGEIIEILGAQ